MIKDELAKYNWYHIVPLGDGLSTPGIKPFTDIVEWSISLASTRDMAGKDLLDVGCRDCLSSFAAERKGARVTAIDNDISLGARDFLIPYFNSKVDLRHLSLYDLNPAEKQYDFIQFFGVLYHLRYPFRALRTLLDCLKVGGEIMIEGGFLYDRTLQRVALMHCPVDDNPYDPSSCTFFNEVGIDQTMKHFGCEKTEGMKWLESDTNALRPDWYASIRRGFVAYRKTSNMRHAYWEPGGKHTYHTRLAHEDTDWKADSTI